MKKPNRFPSLGLAAALPFSFFLTLSLSAPALAQDLIQDTLAVRILLDQNGLTSTSVAQVTARESDRVTALRLSGLQILSLPPQIGALSALKYLTLTDNLLDALPEEVWNLSELIEIDLGGNRINALSPKIGGLKKLLLLGLRENGLSVLPPEVYTLPQLTTLLLAGNDLDSLPEAIADPPFLKYLDLSGNLLRTVPYTLAAMDLDSLDLSSNLLESLPGLIAQMKAGTRVHLGSNRLCGLGASLDAWAEGKEPGYKASQVCGSGVRRTAAPAAAPALRVMREGNSLRVDSSALGALGGAPGSMTLALRDIAGRVLLRVPVASGARELRIASATLGAARGFLWAELVRDGAPALVTPVLPR